LRHQYSVVGDVLRAQARLRPRELAMRHLDRSATWKELDARASQVANAFRSEGLGARGRIAYFGRNSDRYVELLYGAAKAGCIVSGVNWRLAPREVAYVLGDFEPQVLVVSQEFLPILAQIRSDLHLERILSVEDEGSSPELGSYSAWRDAHPFEDPFGSVSADDPLLVVYTSGTTANPKGAMISHANLLSVGAIYGDSGEECYELRDREVLLAYHPFFHNAASLLVWFATRGGAAIVLPDFDPGQILDLVKEFRVRRLALVPTMIQMLLDHPRAAQADLSSLVYVVYGAAPISEKLRSRAMNELGVQFIQQYGMTESTGLATYLPPRDHRGECLSSVGIPFPAVRLAIMDESGREQPCGAVGEICLRGPNVTSGYWRRAETSDATFRGGWLRTGDAGHLDVRGYLHLKDRIKDLIISGGENISSVEVEMILSEHPGVREVAVVGVPDEKWGETVKAFVVRGLDVEVTTRELLDFAGKRLARFKRPRAVEFVSELPRNAMGKVLKRELRGRESAQAK